VEAGRSEEEERSPPPPNLSNALRPLIDAEERLRCCPAGSFVEEAPNSPKLGVEGEPARLRCELSRCSFRR
jgi:hypothetical protein